MKPHIVQLIASTGLYGAEKWIFALMRAIDTDKFTSTLVNLTDKNENEVSAIVGAAKEIGLNAYDFFTGGRYNPFSIMRFSRWLENNEVNIIHGHGYKSDLIGLFASRLTKCKMITTAHGWSKEKDIKLRYYEKLDRFLFRYMDYVCVLSEDLLESVKSCTMHDRRKLILNGVDILEVTDAPHLVFPSGNGFRIGYVGQLIERKNISVLINAIKELSDQGNEIMLILIGDGPELKPLKSLTKDLGIQDRVKFLGYRKDAISIMKSFDVFVLPSLLEGIPRCVMEAMVAKVPVVASNIPGNSDIIHDGRTGLLFEKTDHRDLATKVDMLLKNNDLRSNMAKLGYENVLNNYSNHRMALQYQSLYQAIL